MAKRTASAKKQARAGARRTVRNRGVRSEVKTLIVKARKSLAGSGSAAGDDRRTETIEAIRALDRAASKGILHPNNAARRKARLARQLAKVAAAPAPAAASAKGKKAAAPAAARPAASKAAASKPPASKKK